MSVSVDEWALESTINLLKQHSKSIKECHTIYNMYTGEFLWQDMEAYNDWYHHEQIISSLQSSLNIANKFDTKCE